MTSLDRLSVKGPFSGTMRLGIVVGINMKLLLGGILAAVQVSERCAQRGQLLVGMGNVRSELVTGGAMVFRAGMMAIGWMQAVSTTAVATTTSALSGAAGAVIAAIVACVFACMMGHPPS